MWMERTYLPLQGNDTDAHLIVIAPTGKLVVSAIETTDLATTTCLVGAILIEEQGYQLPIGQRIYDQHTIRETGLQENSVKKNDD